VVWCSSVFFFLLFFVIRCQSFCCGQSYFCVFCWESRAVSMTYRFPRYCSCHLGRFNSVTPHWKVEGKKILHFLLFVHFLYPYEEKGLLISLLSCWISSRCLSRFGSCGLLLGENKADHIKNSVFDYTVLCGSCFKGSCLLNGFPSYIMISSALLKSSSDHLLSQACMEKCDVCALGCYLTPLSFSLCEI